MILTIGHSTLPLETFIGRLLAHRVETLIDVRRMPRSRRNPQYNTDALASSLAAAGLTYVHASALGGLRKPSKTSVNTGWRNASFRGFADYMQTEEFERAIAAVVEVAAAGTRVAIMCAESVWWRCHRALITDGLLARGIAVEHILPDGRAEGARLAPFARVSDGRVCYPASEQLSLPELKKERVLKPFPFSEGETMVNKQEVKGTGQKVKGRIKEATGALTANDRLEAEGEMDQGRGELNKNVGKARRKVGEAVKDIGKRIKR